MFKNQADETTELTLPECCYIFSMGHTCGVLLVVIRAEVGRDPRNAPQYAKTHAGSMKYLLNLSAFSTLS